MLKDWTNREAATMGLLVSALSLAAGLASRSVVWGVVCFLVLVALVVLLQPKMAELRIAMRSRAAQKQAAANMVPEQERLLPILAAWDAFHPAASEVVRLFYEIRGPGVRVEPLSLSEWNAFSEALRRALSLAATLYGSTRGKALDLLQPFTEAGKADFERCSVAAADLQNWLSERYRKYLHARRVAGLPGGA